MAWKQLAIGRATAFAAKVIVGFIAIFASSAAHADTVYNYTGNTLQLFFHLIGVTCPATFEGISTGVH